MTTDEIIAELEAIFAPTTEDDDARTVEEWSELMKCSNDAARRKIKAAMKAGRVERVDVRRMNMRGRWAHTHGYRLIRE